MSRRAYRHAAAFWLCLPWVLPQALWLRRRTLTLSGAPGPGLGQTGNPVRLRILGLGDSIIDGVGTPHRSQSLTAQIAAKVAEQLSSRPQEPGDGGVSWHAVGRSGYPTGQIREKLLPELGPRAYDLVVISTGVNDVTGLVRLGRFRHELRRLAAELKRHSPDARIVLLGVPPMWHFPALPQPLRWVIGQRARAFQLTGEAAAAELGWRFLPTDFVPRPCEFAEDGYHPNANSVRRWAAEIASFVDGMIDQREL